MERINTPPTFTDLTLAGLGGKRAAEFFDRCRALTQLPQKRLKILPIFE
jgi:hypothetical protein